MNQIVRAPDQHYYLTKLLGYDYIISYKPGKCDKVADALSKREDPTSAQFFILSILTFDFLSTLLIENKRFSDSKDLHKEALQTSNQHPS